MVLWVDVSLKYPSFALDFAHEFKNPGITALFGPSGCGKSTLLRIIAGLEKGANGAVEFDDHIWQGMDALSPPHERGVGYVFQDARLFDHLSVGGNLRYAHRRARHLPGPDRWDDVIRALDLATLLHRRPATLSGGERQRVAIGRTLLARPRLLLMDEPLAALDVGRKADLIPYISRLPETFALPIIYVTHSIEEVSALADQMVAMTAGRLLAAGGVSETLARLDLTQISGRFEAGAILHATVSDHNAAFQLIEMQVAGQTLFMPGGPLPKGTGLRLRLRARDVSLAITKPLGISIRNILSGQISEIIAEPTTAFAEILVEIGDAQRLRARITRASVAELQLTVGMPVHALIKSVAFDHRALPSLRGRPMDDPKD